jgi:hypothetical protein
LFSTKILSQEVANLESPLDRALYEVRELEHSLGNALDRAARAEASLRDQHALAVNATTTRDDLAQELCQQQQACAQLQQQLCQATQARSQALVALDFHVKLYCQQCDRRRQIETAYEHTLIQLKEVQLTLTVDYPEVVRQLVVAQEKLDTLPSIVAGDVWVIFPSQDELMYDCLVWISASSLKRKILALAWFTTLVTTVVPLVTVVESKRGIALAYVPAFTLAIIAVTVVHSVHRLPNTPEKRAGFFYICTITVLLVTVAAKLYSSWY